VTSFAQAASAARAPLAERSPLGRTDMAVAPLCLGGNVFGWTADESDSFAVLDAYAESGGNFVDTADAYSSWMPGHVGGESETIIGNWMRVRGNRDELVIATKVGKLPTAAGLAVANIVASVDGSLTRLGTDHIDLYYAHMDDETVPLEESLGAFDALVRAGKVRYIAASNFGADRLQQALTTSEQNGLHAFAALQNHYNLMERGEYENSVRAVVAEHGLASLPYYGLARGFLTGKYRSGATIDSPRAAGVAPYLNDRGERVLRAVDACAQRHETSMAAIALAWLRMQPTITAPIASARSVTQFNDLLAMATTTLTDDDLVELANASM
jgi:aryl-alcohol dehydrogenase-like predicted oxidoreductase